MEGICEHDWTEKEEEWDGAPGTGPIMENLPKWHYRAKTRTCKNCKRFEIISGTVLVPETPGHFIAGLYELQPDGNRGYCIEIR